MRRVKYVGGDKPYVLSWGKAYRFRDTVEIVPLVEGTLGVEVVR